MEIKLKPCPFCGNTKIRISKEWPHCVYCDNIDCGAKVKQIVNCMSNRTNIRDVTKAWNRRVYEVLSAVLRAYGISMPEADEDEDPNLTSGQ